MGRKRTVPDHICPSCGERYRPQSHSQVFCSRHCRMAARHPTLIEDTNLRAEVEAHKAERATAPIYRYWHHHA